MNKGMVFALGGLATAAVVALGWWMVEESGWLAISLRSPHPKNLARGIDNYLLRASDRTSYQCAALGYASYSPTGGRKAGFEDSQFDFSPAGFYVGVSAVSTAAADVMVRKLEFFARHGLLEKKALADGTAQFTMTWKGFAESNEQGCFRTFHGQPRATILASQKKSSGGVKIYEVTAHVQPGEPAAWTSDPEFAPLFGGAALQPKPTVFELVRDGNGFAVITESGRQPYTSNRVDPAVVALNVKLLGHVDAQKIKDKLASELEGPLAAQARLCLPIPTRDEVDESDFYTTSTVDGALVVKKAAYFTFYNLLENKTPQRLPVLRGYEEMRRLESLGLAKSEEIAAEEFRNAPAAGAVRFAIEGEALDALLRNPGRCLVAARLVPDAVLDFDPAQEWRTLLRFTARLKVVPVGPLGEKAVQTYGNFRRMAEAGVGLRGTMLITRDGLRFSGAPIRLVNYAPDVSSITLPVVASDRRSAPARSAPSVPPGPPVQVQLLQVMQMSRISADGLTMTYSGAGTHTIAKSSVARTQGKWYVEATLKTRPGATTPDTYTTVGIARNPKSDVEFITGLPRAEAFNMRAINQPVRDGETIGIAFDADAGKAYFFRGGNWTSGPPDNPRAGMTISRSTEYVVYAASSASSSTSLGKDSWTLNFGRSRFKFPIPSGYRSWDGRLAGQVAAGRTGIPAARVGSPAGREGGVNRCRAPSGNIVYLAHPCAVDGLEQLGIIDAMPKSGGLAKRGYSEDRIIFIDPKTGGTTTIEPGGSSRR